MANGLSIGMVVANENMKMLALVDKLGARHSFIPAHTRTVALPPWQRDAGADGPLPFGQVFPRGPAVLRGAKRALL
ncbi:hypothetical protein [Variovorax sp. MHTC-1]|uniref:hypothetical protein n=1 Tax=Variovorax sp. MHTC-1 TaxID=2495593 RepID=UPI000F87A879|nr:hypothetical protein [Variovorax sp. MHTC-1]RST50017.1 hypothetical protein EJI01_22500 [Variovorax sp. MHTC-1]